MGARQLKYARKQEDANLCVSRPSPVGCCSLHGPISIDRLRPRFRPSSVRHATNIGRGPVVTRLHASSALSAPGSLCSSVTPAVDEMSAFFCAAAKGSRVLPKSEFLRTFRALSGEYFGKYHHLGACAVDATSWKKDSVHDNRVGDVNLNR